MRQETIRKLILLTFSVILLLLATIATGCPSGDEGDGNRSTPPSPASFSLSGLSIEPEDALPGEKVIIIATLSNTGGTSGSHDVTLGIDGLAVDSKSTTLGPGSNENMYFEVIREDIASYEVTVDNLSGSFNISIENLSQRVVDALPSLYSFNYEYEIISTLTPDEIPAQEHVTVSGSIDNIPKWMQEVAIVETEIGETLTEIYETIIVNDWIFTRMDVQYPGESLVEGTWIHESFTEYDWAIYSIDLSFLVNVLIDATNLEYHGIETVNGYQCLKISITPGEEAIASFGPELEQFSIISWIDIDTKFIVKTTSDISTATETYSEVTLFDQFNDPITIELPIEATLVSIPDPNLEAIIRGNINKSEGPIYMSDMETITNLDAQSRGISDLSGLEYCANLQSLDLNYNNIGDLSPLADLTKLETLKLLRFFSESSSFWELSLLTNLVNLETLELSLGQYNNLAPLVNLINLEALDLYIAQSNDITPVASITSLKTLQLHGNFPLPPLAGLVNLEMLLINQQNLNDLSSLVGLTNLGALYLPDNNFSDISVLAGLTGLEELHLENNNISDLSPLAGLTQLFEIHIDNNNISDISVLAGLTNLVTLTIDFNNVGDSDVSLLADLTNLQYLSIENNNISDISFVAGLTNLFVFHFPQNNVSDISSLAGLTNLYELHFFDNNVSDISVLAGLTNLDELGLHDNNISDISPLVANTGLAAGDFIALFPNPLSATSLNIYVPQLEARGIIFPHY